MTVEILSKENNQYKELKLIINKKNDFIFIEGKKIFEEAFKKSAQIETIFLDKKNLHLLDKYPKALSKKVTFMSNDLISSLFTTENKPESDDLILAIAKQKLWSISDLIKPKGPIVLLDRIQDPGNLGVILRSALAFNAGGVILTNNSVYPYITKVVRASAGAIFDLPIVCTNDLSDIKSELKSENYNFIGTVKSGGKSLKDIDLKQQNVFMFGNEGSGISEEITSLSDELLTIPQSDKVESLNLSVSVSLILWEVFFQ